MDDNKFWLTVCKYGAILIGVIIISGMASCQSSKYQLRKMTEATGSGMEAACAMEVISDGGLNTPGTAIICNKLVPQAFRPGSKDTRLVAGYQPVVED